MSHELETIGGKTAFAGRLDAWHRLGQILPEGLKAEDVMDQALLGGWDVRKNEVFTPLLTDSGVAMTKVEGKFATVRTNPATKAEELIGIGGVVGSVYTPFQNEQLVEFLQAIVDESHATFETAGSLRGGADVFVTMKLPETMVVGGTDELDLNIAVLNNHVGTAAIRGLITPTRIVCANTQRAALGNARASFKIRHTAGAEDRVQEAREALGLTFAYLDQFQVEAEKMINETLTMDVFKKVCDELWAPINEATASERSKTIERNRNGRLRQLFESAPTNENIRNTRWAGYQSITEYLDHVAPVNGKTEQAKVINRAQRAIDGDAVATKERAFALLQVA